MSHVKIGDNTVLKFVDAFMEAVAEKYEDADSLNGFVHGSDTWDMANIGDRADSMMEGNTVQFTEPKWRYDKSSEWTCPEVDGHTMVTVDEEGGYEGSGEYCHRVFCIAKIDDNKLVPVAFVMATGYYASYDGSNYEDGFEEVEPFKKPVFDFRKV